jgi:hypothetical protein
MQFTFMRYEVLTAVKDVDVCLLKYAAIWCCMLVPTFKAEVSSLGSDIYPQAHTALQTRTTSIL